MSKENERFYRWIEGIIIGIVSGIIVLVFGQNDLSSICKPFVYSVFSGSLGYGFYLRSKKKYHKLFYLSLFFFILALYLFYLGIKC